MFKAKAEEKQVELRYEFDPGVAETVTNDPVRLRQVVTNLLDNAIKFTVKGEVALMVRNYECDGAAGIMFTITDTGSGIEAGRLRFLFKPFAQGDVSTTRRYGGTGLGLAISAEIIKLLKGRIWVESQVGKGSAFHFVIPLHPGSGPIEGPAGAKEPASGRKERPVPLKILLAEDEAVSRVLTTELLEAEGHKVHAVHDGRKAVDAVLADRYDLVLMDLEMPEMDGMNAIAAIREKEGPDMKRLPIIAVTAQAFADDRRKCLEAGADGYISKPITEENLFQIMAEAAGAAPAENGPANNALSGQFDTETIRNRTKGNVGVLKKMVRIFIETYPHTREQIEAAIASGDGERLWRAAHKLKGAVSFFDEKMLLEKLHSLEMAGRNNNLASAKQTWADLQAETDRFVNALEASVRP